MKALTFLLLLLLSVANPLNAKVIDRFDSPAAKQGVAIDEDAIYVISNFEIIKYDKTTKDQLAHWACEEGKPLIHLNAGTIHEGKLYCAHSNYPEWPMESSIEVWDTETLEHIESISLGVFVGSATWVVRHKYQWWMGFAHYSGRGANPGQDNSWTQVIVLDDNWQRVRGYTFPKDIKERFGTRSNSGGDWGPDGRLYITGHDHKELYVMELPTGGSKLVHLDTIPAEIEGQAFMWDRTQEGHLYGIIKGNREVIISDLSEYLAKD